MTTAATRVSVQPIAALAALVLVVIVSILPH
jgi:hypothetical protein